MDDQQILTLFWNRAEQAIQALADTFGKGLYRLSMNILGSHQDAEESVSDTYLALWYAIPPEKPSPLCPYVYRVGRNTALNKLRASHAAKRSTQYTLSFDELSGAIGTDSLGDTIDAKVLGQAIDRFLDTQKPINRIIFVRRYWFGDSVKDLADFCHVSPNCVSVRLNRLRKELKDYLDKEGILQ